MGHFGALGRELGWFILSRIYRWTRQEDDLGKLYHVADALGRLAQGIVRARRKLFDDNVAEVFPEWSASARTGLIKAVTREQCRNIVDIFYYTARPSLLRQRLTVENPEVLDAAVALGKGIVFATGHVGMFPFVGTPLTWKGIPYGVVARPPHDARVARMLDSVRDDLSIITVPDRPVQVASRIMLRVLRNNGAILTPLDIHPGADGGPVVDFLGRKTLMFSGSARVAAKTGAPIVCARVLREKDGYNHRVRYWPAEFVPREAADGKSEAARDTVAGLSDWLSGVIREDPEQWLWMHKRWRPRDLQ